MTSFDLPTVDELRRAGSLKWSLFPDRIGAFVAEMDFGTAPAVVQALHAGVDQNQLGYLPVPLREQLSAACAGWLAGCYGWQVPGDRVRPLGDVIAGLQAAIDLFTPPHGAVIVPTPAYMPFLTVPAAMGRRQIEVPMREIDGQFGYDLDALDAAFTDGGKLLILCNPHNPLGRVLTEPEMLAVAEVVERHSGRVFSDEIHAPLVYAGNRHVPYASLSEITAGHTITATSASKAWNLPGLKCAQLILSNQEDAEHWAAKGLTYEHGASTLGVIANTAAYTAGGPWLEEVLDHLDGSRRLLADLVAEHLPGVGYTAPEGTYLALLDCRELGLDERPADFFAEHAGVVLTDGSLCGQAGQGFARYNFATPRPIMQATLEAMGTALARR